MHDDEPFGDRDISPEALAAERNENNERERRLYGDLLADKLFLQRRGYAVYRVGRSINVGKRVLSVPEFKRLAERERCRLSNERKTYGPLSN